MKFLKKRNVKSKEEHVFLKGDSWDDWFKYSTLFHVYYFNPSNNGYSLIGSIKIGEDDMTSKRTPEIPNSFTQLPNTHFSVGQDVSYYENLAELSDETRNRILTSLNDISFKEEHYQKSIKLSVTRISLLRGVTSTSVRGQFRRIAQGNSSLTKYEFKYIPYGYGPDFNELKFNVIPESNPPTNIHVFIGRNGVGKTFLLNNMIHSLLKPKAIKYGKFLSDEGRNFFANLVSVNFSAFDETKPPKEERDTTKQIKYTYLGLKRITKNSKTGKEYLVTKSEKDLLIEFVKSLEACKRSSKISQWQEALFELESDQLFKKAAISKIGDIEDSQELINRSIITFKNLSSGHKIVLLTITRLVETIEEKSLVILDEPETHLHPPLLSAFIRSLSNLLTSRNGVAIVATHSPVVLQEVPNSCAFQIRRSGNTVQYDRLPIESFGENVGVLTREVFGLEVTDSGFHKLIAEIAERSETIEEVLTEFNGELGFEAKALARTIMNKKNL